MPDFAATTSSIFEKVEGLAVTSEGDVWMNSDNDGVYGSSGEQQLINIRSLNITGTAAPVGGATTDEPTAGPGTPAHHLSTAARGAIALLIALFLI